MRLHLVIQRHDLPTTRIIWTTPSSNLPSTLSSFPTGPSAAPTRVSSTGTSFVTASSSFEESNYTVARLLADVNEVIPLETLQEQSGDGQGHIWVLEDYVVEIMGSECLHFMSVENLMRDNDEVIIRPLQYDDIAARRLTGRHQVAADGSYLIDGIPFGKRLSKRATVTRPPVVIPPRKKRRFLEPEGWSGVSFGSAGGGSTLRSPSEAEDHTLAIEDQSHNDLSRTENPLREREEDVAKEGPIPAQAPTSTVLQDHAAAKADSGSNAHLQSTTASPVNIVSKTELDYDSDSSRSGSEQSASSDNSPSSSSESSSEESDDEVPIVKKSSTSEETAQLMKNVQPAVKAPGDGSSRTKRGNIRAKKRRKLMRLKKIGILGDFASFTDLRSWEELPNYEKERQANLAKSSIQAAEFQQAQAKLLQVIESSGADVSPLLKGLETAAPASKENQPASLENITPLETPTREQATTPANKSKSKLDIPSAQRLLFGSLGVKAPKTMEDKEKLRISFSQHVRTPEVPETQSIQETVDTLQPVENWQNSIVLRATECMYDVELKPPPFPFVQRWDREADAIIFEKKNSQSASKKRKRAKNKRKSNYEEYDWSGEYANENTVLDYDDNGGVALDEEIPAEGEQPEREVVEADDLPPLPENVSFLPDLVVEDLIPRVIIAFKHLEMSQATNWAPIVTDYKTAVLESIVETFQCQFRLAKRDRTKPKTIEDTDGQPRVYSKFEMPGYDEEEETDDGFRELQFEQLIEPKLVRAASFDTPAEEVAESQVARLRREVSQFIKDAGYRSGIDSLAGEVEDFLFSRVEQSQRAVGAKSPETGDPAEGVEGDEQNEPHRGSPVLSPTFEGFGLKDKDEASMDSMELDGGASLQIPENSTVPENADVLPQQAIDHWFSDPDLLPIENAEEKEPDEPDLQDKVKGEGESSKKSKDKTTAEDIRSKSFVIDTPVDSIDQSVGEPIGSGAQPTTRLPDLRPSSALTNRVDNPFDILEHLYSDSDSSVSLGSIRMKAKKNRKNNNIPQPTRTQRQRTSLPSGSQIPIGSQVVDLTLTTDPVVPEKTDSDEDFTIPRGGGWITKRQPPRRNLRRGRNLAGSSSQPAAGSGSQAVEDRTAANSSREQRSAMSIRRSVV
ncbi:hypothetical protein FQN57_000754 [Myotisia sp. PD_48]|nr:hypothetical protein FQN57_000754 [Myotisia sp. PD_48]